MEHYRGKGTWRGIECVTRGRSFADVASHGAIAGPIASDAGDWADAPDLAPMHNGGTVVHGSVALRGKLAHLGDISPQELGNEGERIAVSFLERFGFVILRRNWKSFAGEADIVAQDGDDHVLIEVKTRLVTDRTRNPWPELAVDARKRERYRVMAELYLQELDEPVPVRFDVIAINIVSEDVVKVRYLEGAFECDR